MLHFVDFIEHRNQLHLSAALVYRVLSTHYMIKRPYFGHSSYPDNVTLQIEDHAPLITLQTFAHPPNPVNQMPKFMHRENELSCCHCNVVHFSKIAFSTLDLKLTCEK